MNVLVVLSLCIYAVTGAPQYPVYGYGFPYPRFSKTSELQPTVVPAPTAGDNEELPIFSISDLINAGELEQPQGEQYVEQYICLNVIQLPPKLFGNRHKHNKRPRFPGYPGQAPQWVDGRQLASDQTSLQFMCANVVTSSQISDILDAVQKPATFAPQITTPIPESPSEIPDLLAKQTEATTISPVATTPDPDARKFPTPYPPAPGLESIEKESVEIEAADERKINPALLYRSGLHPGLLHPGHPGLYPQVPLPLHQQRIGYYDHPRPIFPGYAGPYH